MLLESFSQGGGHMKSIRCFAVTLVLVGLLAGCLCLGGANTVAYAASPGVTIATGTPSFCQELPKFITKVEALKPGPLRNWVLAGALRIYGKYCGGRWSRRA